MSIPFPLLVVFKLRSHFVLAQLIFFGKNAYFNSHFICYLIPHKHLLMVSLFLYFTYYFTENNTNAL